MQRATGSRNLRNQDNSRAREGRCPSCGHRVLCSEADGDFDCEGFESYQIDCASCHTSLNGIVDPFDEVLLLSVASRAP
jgi:hypothetical protein